jgi:hypothetical protein
MKSGGQGQGLGYVWRGFWARKPRPYTDSVLVRQMGRGQVS